MKRELMFVVPFLVIFLTSILVTNLIGPSVPQYLLGRFNFFSHVFPSDNDDTQKPSQPGGCDYSIGRWVLDETNPQSYKENCPFLDPGFRCQRNGRNDVTFQKWRWQPHGCDLPRFNARELLERSRNGRIVFAGDSVGRNQWESLLCMLRGGVSNESRIYEVNGKPISKHKGYLAMRFQEYNLTVEYYRTPFLSLIAAPPRSSSTLVHKTIQLDKLHWYSRKWVGADVLVFNSGHWWNPDKTTNIGCYFQEGGNVNMTMDVTEAYRKSLHTWKSWASSTLDPKKSFIFFRSYSPVHYRGGNWNEGGGCDMETEPEEDPTKVEAEPYKNKLIWEVMKQLEDEKWKAQFLNITYLSDIRKDGHPSKYREEGTPPGAPQDCSHWCLPGVPDTWNQLLYAYLLSKNFGVFQERGTNLMQQE